MIKASLILTLFTFTSSAQISVWNGTNSECALLIAARQRATNAVGKVYLRDGTNWNWHPSKVKIEGKQVMFDYGAGAYTNRVVNLQIVEWGDDAMEARMPSGELFMLFRRP